MMHVSQKEIRNMVGKPYVEDITHGTEVDRIRIFEKEGWLDTIAYASGYYGRNATLYRGHNTGTLYVITCRSSAMYIFD